MLLNGLITCVVCGKGQKVLATPASLLSVYIGTVLGTLSFTEVSWEEDFQGNRLDCACFFCYIVHEGKLLH